MTRTSLRPVRFGLRVILLLRLFVHPFTVACIGMAKDVWDDLWGPLVEEVWVAPERHRELVMGRLESERGELRLSVGWVVLMTDR